jgi:hypothetical protein
VKKLNLLTFLFLFSLVFFNFVYGEEKEWNNHDSIATSINKGSPENVKSITAGPVWETKTQITLTVDSCYSVSSSPSGYASCTYYECGSITTECDGNTSTIDYAPIKIKETIKVFIREFPKSVWGYKIFAVIIYTGSAPKKTKDKELKELLDKFPFLKKRNQGDITLYVKQLE